MRSNTKINRHQKIAAILKSGNPISPEEIRKHFTGTDQESVLYRLTTNIYNIKKDGGVVKVYKDKRRVSAYQLMNPHHFNDKGRFIGKSDKHKVSV